MWFSLLTLSAVIAVLFIVPGAVVALSAGARGFWVVGLAPAVSVGLISVSAIAAKQLGFSWGLGPVLMLTVLSSVCCLAIWALLRRKDLNSKWSSSMTNQSPKEKCTYCVSAVLGFFIASLVMLRVGISILGDPENISQSYDNIFHLNLSRWILDTGNGSSLNIGMSGSEVFYPAAWHDLVSLGLNLVGSSDVVVGNNATIIAALSVAWPLSSLLMVTAIFPRNPIIPVIGGIMSVAFTVFPLFPLGFGVLYPNFLGWLLMPSMVALAVNLFRFNKGLSMPLTPTLLLGMAGGAGISLAHPNALVAYLCVMCAALAFTSLAELLYKSVKITGFSAKTCGLAAALLALVVVDLVIYRALAVGNVWSANRYFAHAFGEAILVMPNSWASNYLAAVLTFCGIFFILKRRRYLWLLLSHFGFCLIWIVIASFPSGALRSAAASPWYGDPFRTGCLMVFTAIPISVYGGYCLLEKALKFFEARVRKNNPWVEAVVTVVFISVTLLGTQLLGMPEMIKKVAITYEYADQSALVSESEKELIEKVPNIVPEGDVVVVNPWNGSSMLYALTGVKTTEKHILTSPSVDQQLIADHLDDAAQMPRVCHILSEEDAKWVLSFSDEILVNNPDIVFNGFDQLSSNPGFVEVARVGDAALYKITACGNQ